MKNLSNVSDGGALAMKALQKPSLVVCNRSAAILESDIVKSWMHVYLIGAEVMACRRRYTQPSTNRDVSPDEEVAL